MRRYSWLVIVILIKVSVSFIGMVEIREALAQRIPERREVQKIYWGDIGTNQIQRANPDGSNIETVVTAARPWDLALDNVGGKIYWVSLANNSVRRSNLDGSNVEDLVTGRGGEGIDLDLAAGKMYWAGSGQIQRANLDGSEIESLITGLSKPDSMALDLINRKVYWTDSIDGTIQRAKLDGSNIEVLITGLSEPQGLNLDLVDGKMYWSNWPPIDKIQRANLDGSNIEDIAPGFGGLEGIALDFNAGKMYWTDFRIDKIQRANFDGSDIEDIVTTGLSWPISIIFDFVPPIPLTFTPSTVADQTFTVGRPVNLTLPSATGGTAPYSYTLSPIPAGLQFNTTTQVLSGTPTTATPATPATYTATDATGQTASLTFTITVTDPPTAGITFVPSVIDDLTLSVNTPMEPLYLPLAEGGTPPYTYTLNPIPVGLSFDAAIQQLSGTPTTVGTTAATYTATDATGASASLTFTITVRDTPSLTDVYMYWVELGGNKIRRANLDGTNVEDLVTGFGRPVSIALDIVGGKMYWTDRDRLDGADPAGRSSIRRANLDGSNPETLILGGNTIKEYIALDISGGKMYWTEWDYLATDDKIRRANLDGSNIEDLVTGLKGPRGIALDVPHGKMYWTNDGKIHSTNLDGSNIQDVITGDGAHGIALDSLNGKIYWTAADKIQRANLDGTNLEDVVGDLQNLFGIALDSLNGKIYWTAAGNLQGIQRANLDGTNLEDVVTGLSLPIGIALGIPQVPAGVRFTPNMIADQMFTVGTYASLDLPIATGGTAPYIYTLTPNPPAGLQFDAFDRWIGGTPTTPMQATPYTYTAMDTTGASASLTFTIEVTGTGTSNLDVNRDGQVNVVDLAIVALFYGTRVPVDVSLAADVNVDGVVNLLDLTAVAQGIDAAGGVNGLSLQELEAALLAGEIEGVAGAPMGFGRHPHTLSLSTRYGNVAAALADVRQMTVGDVRLGKGMAVLEGLLQLLAEMGAIPDTTALLPNYPNPFNPETWIPYHLAKDAEVIVTIYDIRGVSVRELVLGHQSAGVYQSRGRATYWDGRNASGEPVASGVYFYTLTAGDFTGTRKMLIRK